MPNFISDEEMAKLEASQKTPDFISDEEMANLEKEKPWYDISAEGLGRSALEALPVAGSLVGGALGSLVAPVAGTIGGAGLGAAAGKALEQAGKKAFFDEGPQTREAQYKGIIGEGLAGAGAEMTGPLISKGVSKVGEMLPTVSKVASQLTGIPEQEIKTYKARSKEIETLAKASDKSTIEAADIIRQKYMKDIRNSKDVINKGIDDVLKNSDKSIKVQPVVDKLNEYKNKIDKALYPEQIAQVDDIISQVQATSENGLIPAARANGVKKFLQLKAESAYQGPGDIFSVGKEAANVAKQAAAKTRMLIDEVEPKVTQLNSQLADLHNIESNMNKNLIKEGSPEAALMAAGTGGNPRNVRSLEKLGEFTGTPMLQEAQDLAAMRTFTDVPFLPIDTTGKSMTRLGAGSSIGASLGGLVGGLPGAAIGGTLGGIATSPAATKAAIDISNVVGKAIPKFGSPEATQMIQKSIMQKYLSPKIEETPIEETPKIPDQGYIMEKIKGTPYEKILNNSLQSGGQQSFAAANYVLQNRDQKYRELMSERES
jgi:hypothetical protein